MLLKFIGKLENIYYHSSSERFCNHLKKCGVSIGEGTVFYSKSAHVDITRPSLIQIGSYCLFNENFTLLTHDYVSGVFVRANMSFLPSSGRVTIGNNVRFGRNCMVLKGVTIGENCFIGANSLVTKDIPSNSVAAGSPCRVICSLEEYHRKCEVRCQRESLEYARSIQERYGRRPVTSDFWEEFPLFIDGAKIDDYPELKQIIVNQCGPMYEKYKSCHKATYPGFDAFLGAAGVE